MNTDEFKEHTKSFGLRIIKLIEALPRTTTASVIGKQLLRCGTSVGANYRAACRGKSKPDFVAKMGIVEEECDEAIYWMELLIESKLVDKRHVADLMKEANKILSMTVASIRTARAQYKKAKS